MITGHITHEEAVIRHFVKDLEFADLYFQTVPNASRWTNVAAVL